MYRLPGPQPQTNYLVLIVPDSSPSTIFSSCTLQNDQSWKQSVINQHRKIWSHAQSGSICGTYRLISWPLAYKVISGIGHFCSRHHPRNRISVLRCYATIYYDGTFAAFVVCSGRVLWSMGIGLLINYLSFVQSLLVILGSAIRW